MLSKLLLFIAVLLTSFASAQDIQILSQTTSSGKPKAKTFHFISKKYDLSGKQIVATLKGCLQPNEKRTLADLFYSFWSTANKLGANSFVIDSLCTSQDFCFILKVYSLSDNNLDSNYALYPTNLVYVIGDIDRRQTSKTIKFNNEKMELQPMEYISYQNKVGEKCTLSIGGITGARSSVRGEPGKLPDFYSVAGFGVGPGGAGTYGGSVGFGLSFNTGRINPVAPNLGLFLVAVLKERKIK